MDLNAGFIVEIGGNMGQESVGDPFLEALRSGVTRKCVRIQMHRCQKRIQRGWTQI